MSTITFVGYGRFGSALASLFREAGDRVRAFDEGAEIPDDARASSLDEAVREADFVVIAVPVPRIAEALTSVRPHLHGEQIVLDVGSVKVAPTAALAATLGREIPWAATHPLFGPVSLLRGDRPLRAVVCPNAVHPGAVAAVHALYARIGCEVLEQDADAHDRAMARTHAMAFFIAKGLMDAGVPADLPYAPPSFQAIARTIESVRADAGHLYAALHRENPYAAEARRAFCDALASADRGLLEASPRAESTPAIPDLGAVSPALGQARELIDDVDREILALLARRARLARRAAAAKADLGLAVRDARREEALLAARRREATDLGLDADRVAAIFEAILGFSRGVQEPR